MRLFLLQKTTSIKPQYINSGLEALGTTLSHGCKLIELISPSNHVGEYRGTGSGIPDRAG